MKVIASAGPAPYAISSGDFNGDGHVDLATANRYNSVSVLLGNGDGMFQPYVNYGAGIDPASIATGDFNGDTKTDIVTANRGDWTTNDRGSVSVLLGNGDGTFQQNMDYDTGGSGSYSTATGDFNGDGWTDLTTANFGSGNISVLLNIYGLPTGSVSINNGAEMTSSETVELNLSATDDSGVVAQMRFSNDGINWSSWETYATSKTWTLLLNPPSDVMTVYVQFKDGTGNVSNVYSDDIFMDTDNDGWRDSQDCNPIEPGINPGATEIVGNGVDDNCNGITVLTATYNAGAKKLTVEASSTLGQSANLQLNGNNMTWNAGQSLWSKTLTGVTSYSASVSGSQGIDSITY